MKTMVSLAAVVAAVVAAVSVGDVSWAASPGGGGGGRGGGGGGSWQGGGGGGRGGGAWQGGGGGGSWQGGGRGGGAWQGGGAGSWHGGGRGGSWYGGGHHGGGHSHGGGSWSGSVGLYFGLPLYGAYYGGYYPGYYPGYPWYSYPYYSYPYPYYSYPYYAYPYPYYSPNAYVPYSTDQPAAVASYVERDPGYRYYCRDPAGFYPQVKDCSSQWLKVLPEPERGARPMSAAPFRTGRHALGHTCTAHKRDRNATGTRTPSRTSRKGRPVHPPSTVGMPYRRPGRHRPGRCCPAAPRPSGRWAVPRNRRARPFPPRRSNESTACPSSSCLLLANRGPRGRGGVRRRNGRRAGRVGGRFHRCRLCRRSRRFG